MPTEKKRTFQERVEIRVNTVLIALERLARVSNGENVVPGNAATEIGGVIRAAVDKTMSGIGRADRKVDGLKLKAKF